MYCFLPLHRFFQERVFRVCEQILIKYYRQVGRNGATPTNGFKDLEVSFKKIFDPLYLLKCSCGNLKRLVKNL